MTHSQFLYDKTSIKEYLEAAKLNKRKNENNLPDWNAVLKSNESTPKPEVRKCLLPEHFLNILLY